MYILYIKYYTTIILHIIHTHNLTYNYLFIHHIPFIYNRVTLILLIYEHFKIHENLYTPTFMNIELKLIFYEPDLNDAYCLPFPKTLTTVGFESER